MGYWEQPEAMKDKQIPQETKLGGKDIPDYERSNETIAHARRVTAEYMGHEIIQHIDENGNHWEEIVIDGNSMLFHKWNPHTDYNQLMMVVEKLRESGELMYMHFTFPEPRTGCMIGLKQRADIEICHQDLRIAILLCVTKAITSLKK